MKATLVETFRWVDYASIRGFTLHENDVQLPGMITITMSDVDRSLTNAIHEYKTGYTWIENIDGAKVLRSGPWASVHADEVRSAVLEEIGS